MVTNWVGTWDQWVWRWLAADAASGPLDADPLPSAAATGAHNSYGNEGRELGFEIPPEPYVGDPLGDVTAVWLTLNPGQATADHHGPNTGGPGAVFTSVSTAGYYETYRTPGAWPQATQTWWSEWSSMANAVVQRTDPPLHGHVGIDLLPYHSEGFGRIRKGRGNSPQIDYLRDHVVDPAIAISRGARVSNLHPERLPVLFGITSAMAYYLTWFGFRKLVEFNQSHSRKFGGVWPEPDRKIAWLERAQGRAVVTWRKWPRPMAPPALAYADVFRRIIETDGKP